MDINESIAKICKLLMMREPFYGLFLLQLNKKVVKGFPTAGVGKNGINYELIIGEEFWETLNDDQRIGLLKHELLHIAFMHLLMGEDFADKEMANIAMDIEINQYIDPQYYPTPDLMLPSTFPELNLPLKAGTREYYKLLEQAMQQNKSPKLKEILDAFKAMKGMGQPGQGQGDGQGQGKGTKWDKFKHDWEEAFGKGVTEAERKLMQKQIEYQIKDIVENQIKDRGYIPGELKSMIDALYEIIPPAIDWKQYLRRFFGNSNKTYTKKSRRKYNKRYPENPALKIRTKKHVLVAIDTSGSVSDGEVKEFFSEIYHIYKTGVKISIAECDAVLHRVYEYDGTPPEYVHGRGGTDFQPVIDYLNANPKMYTSLVYLSDMECNPPTKPCKPVLWVGSSRANIENHNIKEWYGPAIQIQN